MSRLQGLAGRARTLVAVTVLGTGLAVPLFTGATPAGASTKFCTAIFSWAYHPAVPPTGITLASYRAWAKKEVPYWNAIAAASPNANDKKVATFVATVFKEYASLTSLSKLAAYEKAHNAQFQADVKAFAKDVAACATAGIKLP